MLHAETPQSRKRLRHGLVVLGFSLAGIGILAGTAIAAQVTTAASTAPVIKLTMVDTDVVAVSGRNFPASTDIVVQASSTNDNGTGTVKSTAEGRILLAFSLPSDLDGTLTITAGTQGAKATIDVDGAGSTTTTSTTTASTATTTSTTTPATTTTSTTVPPSTPVLSTKISDIPGVSAFNQKVATYNKLRDTENANVKTINARLAASDDATAEQVQDALTQLNATEDALNKTVAATNTAVGTLNTKANAATTQAQLDALAPDVTALSAKMDAQITAIQNLIDMENKVIAKLPAVGGTTTTTSTTVKPAV